jgi:hypothetical protein
VTAYLQQRETKRAAALKAAAARVHAKRQAEKERAANDAYIRQVYCDTTDNTVATIHYCAACDSAPRCHKTVQHVAHV